MKMGCVSTLTSGYVLAFGWLWVMVLYTARRISWHVVILMVFVQQIRGAYGLDSGLSSMSVWVCSG